MSHPKAHFIDTLPEATQYLLQRVQKDDVVLVLSAGDADQVSENLLIALES
jgi:UDP-N-acetylmuramate-alanine ligase